VLVGLRSQSILNGIRRRSNMIISKTEYIRCIIEALQDGYVDEQTDNNGQILIHTGMYEWVDGTIRDDPDPDFE
jgi:hypothetical protein